MIKDPRARITRIESWKDYYLFSLDSSTIASQAQPGQFIMVRTSPHSNPLLRRPFSIHSRNGKNIEIFFQRVGIGTALLSEKRENDVLDILGPLGKGFHTSPDYKGKEAALIGGGRGIAPLYFLAQELRDQGASVKIFYGGKTYGALPLKNKFEKNGFKLFCSTDDGSFRFHGLITEFFGCELQNFTPGQIFACGPEPMLKKIALMAQERKIPAEFSLESVMGCGFGACWSCVKRIKKDGKEGWHKICEDGPVYSADEIVWQEEGL